MHKMDSDTYKELLSSLIENHSIFYKFWSICRPTFSAAVDTAAVSFDKEYNCISFLINKDFWATQTNIQKKFIICHECLHILNLHSKRVENKFSPQANIAMDIVVNESLVKYFNFKRKDIDPKLEFCWMDTVFPEKNVESWYNFEYYLNLLNNDLPPTSFKLINGHEMLGKIPESFLKEFSSEFSDEEKDIIKNILEDSEKKSIQAGSQAGALVKEILETSFKTKKKWELIIQKFEKKIKKELSTQSHWLNKPRRLAFTNNNIFIPSDIEFQIKKTKSTKITTWFFLDTSGSCWHLSDRFFKAAKSLDPKVFDVKYFYFDTEVYETNIHKNKKVYGGGGTSFDCIIKYIQSKNANPFVWIITDGYGGKISIPDNQQRKWSWFLTENNSKEDIPAKCRIYNLSDFE